MFMQELRAIYEGLSRVRNADLPELTLQYADYASWQRGWLQGETLSAQLAFWRAAACGRSSAADAADGRPRPEKQTFAGACGEVHGSARALYRPLKALCRKEGVTLFMALLAAYQMLLSRLSGQDQVVVGTDSANRFTVETERMIGFFINILPLEGDLSGEPTFSECAEARARNDARMLCAPGDAVRQDCRGASAGTQPEP